MTTEKAGRRGRPRLGEQEERRSAVLDSAMAELLERGPNKLTMQAVATRAGSSKESLYSWFGNRQGLLAALIRRQAGQVNAAVGQALERPGDPAVTLAAIGRNLLRLLLGEVSVALNRAAMDSPELAHLLLQHGRHTTGPLIASFMSRLADEGRLRIQDGEEAFQLFYGLIVRDLQIRVLLGERPPAEEELDAQSQTAVERFLDLTRP